MICVYDVVEVRVERSCEVGNVLVSIMEPRIWRGRARAASLRTIYKRIFSPNSFSSSQQHFTTTQPQPLQSGNLAFSYITLWLSWQYMTSATTWAADLVRSHQFSHSLLPNLSLMNNIRTTNIVLLVAGADTQPRSESSSTIWDTFKPSQRFQEVWRTIANTSCRFRRSEAKTRQVTHFGRLIVHYMSLVHYRGHQIDITKVLVVNLKVGLVVNGELGRTSRWDA